MADLETRIADAIGAKLSSKDVAALLEEVTAADQEAKATSEAANELALNPATKPADVAKARKAAEDADFSRRRMERAAEALRGEHKDAVARERMEAQREESEAANAERDALAKDLVEYDELARKIAALLVRLRASNMRVGDFNSAEAIVRDAGQKWLVQGDETLPKLLEMVRLPKFRRDGTNHGYLWPQR